MHKTPLLLAAITVLVVVGIAACSSAAPATEAPSNQQQQPAPSIPQSGNTLAPVCQGVNTCEAPTAEQNQLDCVKKVPYTNVLIPPGTAFEVMDKSGNFTCLDSGMVVNGKQVVTCHGTELQSFDLKLTNSACGGTNLAKGTGQCQEGYGYDASQQCCAPLSGGGGGSTTITVDLGGCPLPRP